MDSHVFDRLARAFSQPASRRRALAGLLGGALATLAGASMSEAKRRGHHHHHPPEHHKDCTGSGGAPLPNGTCLMPCLLTVDEGYVCPLTDTCRCGSDSGRSCCTLGIDRKPYCSPGEPSIVSCTSLEDCPKGQFCSASNDCRVACTA